MLRTGNVARTLGVQIILNLFNGPRPNLLIRTAKKLKNIVIAQYT